MRTKVTKGLVRAQAAQLYGLELSDTRCEELARDIERHVQAITAESPRLDFNDEPARFTSLLATGLSDKKVGR